MTDEHSRAVQHADFWYQKHLFCKLQYVTSKFAMQACIWIILFFKGLEDTAWHPVTADTTAIFDGLLSRMCLYAKVP